jgi:hypothetical protein
MEIRPPPSANAAVADGMRQTSMSFRRLQAMILRSGPGRKPTERDAETAASHPGRFDPKFSLAAVFSREVLREVVDSLKTRYSNTDKILLNGLIH